MPEINNELRRARQKLFLLQTKDFPVRQLLLDFVTANSFDFEENERRKYVESMCDRLEWRYKLQIQQLQTREPIQQELKFK